MWEIEKKSLRVITLFKHRFFNKRIGILLLCQIFVLYYIIFGLNKIAASYQCQISPNVFPFLCSNYTFLLVLIFSVGYMYADVPFMNYSEINFLIREKRKGWLISQEIVMLLEAIAFSLSIWIIANLMIFPHALMSMEWNEIWYTMALTNIGLQASVLLNVDYEIIKQFSAIEANVLSILLLVLFIFLLGNIMLFLSQSISRGVSMAFMGIIGALLIIAENISINPWAIWLSPASWIRLDKLLNPNKSMYTPTYTESILVLTGILFVLVFLNYFRLKKKDFNFNNEVS